MESVILKDVLLSQTELERYYGGVVPSHLWQALSVTKDDGIFERMGNPFRTADNGALKKDVRIQSGWVRVQSSPHGAGKSGTPRCRDWTHYRIPKGTALPKGLMVVRDAFHESSGATFYTIMPAQDMPLGTFRTLLSELAGNAVRASV